MVEEEQNFDGGTGFEGESGMEFGGGTGTALGRRPGALFDVGTGGTGGVNEKDQMGEGTALTTSGERLVLGADISACGFEAGPLSFLECAISWSSAVVLETRTARTRRTGELDRESLCTLGFAVDLENCRQPSVSITQRCARSSPSMNGNR